MSCTKEIISSGKLSTILSSPQENNRTTSFICIIFSYPTGPQENWSISHTLHKLQVLYHPPLSPRLLELPELPRSALGSDPPCSHSKGNNITKAFLANRRYLSHWDLKKMNKFLITRKNFKFCPPPHLLELPELPHSALVSVPPCSQNPKKNNRIKWPDNPTCVVFPWLYGNIASYLKRWVASNNFNQR